MSKRRAWFAAAVTKSAIELVPRAELASLSPDTKMATMVSPRPYLVAVFVPNTPYYRDCSMTFLMAYLIALIVPMVYFGRMTLARIAEPAKGAAPMYVQLAMVPILLLAYGFMSGLFFSSDFRPDRDVNYVPYFILAGGILGTCLYGFAALHKREVVPGVVARQGGAWILAALVSAYLSFTAVDHFLFFSDRESTGIMSTELSNRAGIECNAAYLIVKKRERTFQYRCPLRVQFGHQFGQPFIPWPSYVEGSSERLLSEFEKMEAEMARQESRSQTSEKQLPCRGFFMGVPWCHRCADWRCSVSPAEFGNG